MKKYLVAIMALIALTISFSGLVQAQDDTCPCDVDEQTGECLPCPE